MQWLADNVELAGAIFTLIGGVIGALLANWDKIFRPNKVFIDKVDTDVYVPSGDFETEMRILLENVGTRKNIAASYAATLAAHRESMLRNLTDDEREVDKIITTVKKELPSPDQIIEMLMPIWGRHYRLEEVEKVNKLYTTRTMRDFIAKQPQIMQEAVPAINQMNIALEQRIAEAIEREASALPQQ